MSSLIINELYIFDAPEKKAKKVEFSSGINIVTSSKINGNTRGKSMILKSIYHTLGADAIYMNAKWNLNNKMFIVKFTIDTKSYYIFRRKDYFKIFNNNLDVLFTTDHRDILAEYLESIYNFSVYLPNRNTQRLELTPPAYSYLLNYLDQDYINGPNFNSFEKLGQYSNYKESLIFSHFGIFNKEYYELSNKIINSRKAIENLNKEQLFNDGMLSKLNKYMGDTKTSFDTESLELDLNQSKNEYEILINKMNKIKTKLIMFRNEKYEIEKQINELELFTKKETKEIEKVNCICPSCNQEIDVLEEKLKRNYDLEEYIILKNDFAMSLEEINSDIIKEQEKYQEFLDKLKIYEEKVSMINSDISSVLKHVAFNETRDSLLKEFNTNDSKLVDLTTALKKDEALLRKYNKLKGDANSFYSRLMFKSRADYDLVQIEDNQILKIGQQFGFNGSNKPITTLVWYFNLLKTKFEFNPHALKFPLVLDSPKNVEIDDDNTEILFNFILSNTIKDQQMIVSSVGFDKEDYPKYKIDTVIPLENEKYQLLNEKDYQENLDLLTKIVEN